MILQEQDLRELVAKAASLYERMEGDFEVIASPISQRKADKLYHKWMEEVYKGREENLIKRLEWDQWTKAAILPYLGDVKLKEDQALPKWAHYLNRFIEAYDENRVLPGMEQIPFKEIFFCFLKVAQLELLNRLGSTDQKLTQELYGQLQQGLLMQLITEVAEVLLTEFKAFKHTRTFGIGGGFIGGLPGSTEMYQGFLKKMADGGLGQFFMEYPVLAKKISHLIDFWSHNMSQFIHRYQEDEKELDHFFGQEFGQLREVSMSLSDPHNGQQSVMLLTFDKGKLVYKPKDMGMEKNFFEFLGHINEKRQQQDFKLLKVMNKETYGWVEYLENKPCESKEELEAFYRRTGMLICMIYSLEGTDCNYENILASGGYPVLIDMETLFHHQAPIAGVDEIDYTAQKVAGDNLWDSVLRTHYLPKWEQGINGTCYDVSALGGGHPDHKITYKQAYFEKVNEDQMVMKYRFTQGGEGNNLPIYEGQVYTYEHYVEAILAGFKEMYHYLMDHKEHLIKSPKGIRLFANEPVRYVFRNTKTYAMLQRKGSRLNTLTSGILRSIQLDHLAKAMILYDEQPYFWSLLKDEHRALDQGDIPFYFSKANSCDLSLGHDGKIENFFEKKSYHNVVKRIKDLSEEDLQKQLDIMKGCLYVRMTKSIHGQGEQIAYNPDELQGEPLTLEAFVEEAKKIAKELLSKQIVSGEGYCSWIGLHFARELNQYQLQPMGYSYYDGLGGVAVFLSALYSVTGELRYKEEALRVIRSIKKGIQQERFEYTQQHMGLGGGFGVTSLIYVGAKLYEELDEEEPLILAKYVAKELDQRLVELDEKYDLLFGSGGALLCYLKLYEVTGDQTVLQRASQLGDHLMRNQQLWEQENLTAQHPVNNTKISNSYLGSLEENKGDVMGEMLQPKAWRTLEERPLMTGYSHGAAGIAYSLYRLYGHTLEESHYKAAKEAVLYEKMNYIPEKQNWPDFRFDSQGKEQPVANTWCNGAPGIGLGRIGSLQYVDHGNMHHEAEQVVDQLRKEDEIYIDHLCCGNFGKWDTLLEAGVKWQREDLIEEVINKGSQLIRRRQAKGEEYHLNWDNGPYNPGFFQGTTGIGYELLRMAYPEKVESALLWR